jgi:hypothetical protein
MSQNSSSAILQITSTKRLPSDRSFLRRPCHQTPTLIHDGINLPSPVRASRIAPPQRRRSRFEPPPTAGPTMTASDRGASTRCHTQAQRHSARTHCQVASQQQPEKHRKRSRSRISAHRYDDAVARGQASSTGLTWASAVPEAISIVHRDWGDWDRNIQSSTAPVG